MTLPAMPVGPKFTRVFARRPSTALEPAFAVPSVQGGPARCGVQDRDDTDTGAALAGRAKVRLIGLAHESLLVQSTECLKVSAGVISDRRLVPKPTLARRIARGCGDGTVAQGWFGGPRSAQLARGRPPLD